MKIKPHQFFLVGLISTFIVLSILYWLLPSYEDYGGTWSVYKSGQSTPEQLSIKSNATNIYLLKRFGFYALVYWIDLAVIYFIVERIKRFRINERLVKIHFYLSLAGIALAVFLNRFIILPESQSGYLSDSYGSGSFTEEQNQQLLQLMLYYDSIRTPTFVIGVFLLIVGLLVFITNLRQGLTSNSLSEPLVENSDT
ncbi:MAG: hypothetical protein ABI663_13290 [Chryseolinea sp.]